MEEASGRANLVDSADVEGQALTATLPRADVEEALGSENGEVELFLDLARVSEGEEPSASRRVNIAWEHDDLEQLLKTTSGDAITIAFDRRELEEAFEQADVEAHGLREKALVLTVAVATAAAGTSAAVAGVDSSSAGYQRAMPADYAALEAGDYQRAMPSDYASAGHDLTGGAVGAAGESSPAATTGGAVPSSDAADSGPVGAAGEASPAATTGGAVPTSGAADEVAGYVRAMPSDYGVTTGPVAAAGEDAPATVTGGAGEVATGPVGAAGGDAPAQVTGGAVGNLPGGAVAAAGGEAPAAVTGGATVAADTPVGGGEGISIPEPARDAAIAGGLALIITAAGFALRGRRRVEPA
jgi:hypothetical protein